MCTIVILRRATHRWPVLIAANRDERIDRRWREPGSHWPDRPGVVAGLDELAGGSWLGINEFGVAAAILNREGTLGPATGKRSRGELVLEALDHADAAAAAEALSALDPAAYRPFNLLIADNRDAFLLLHRDSMGLRRLEVEPLPSGFSMITAGERDDPSSARIRHYRPLFAAAPPPDPDQHIWDSWESLLADRHGDPDAGPGGALFIAPYPAGDPQAFGTVCSSIIGLPAADADDVSPIFRIAIGSPETRIWEELRPTG